MPLQFTGDDLVKVLNTLEKPQAATLLRTVLGVQTTAEYANMGTAELLNGGLWEFLLAVGFVSEMQALTIVQRMQPAMRDLIRVLEAGGKSLPIFRLTIAERRWATWPMHATWYDFYTQEDVVELPEPPVLMVVGDVTALYLRLVHRLERVRRKDAKPDSNGQPDRGGEGAADRP